MRLISANEKKFFNEFGHLTLRNILDKKILRQMKHMSYDLFKGKYDSGIALFSLFITILALDIF